MHTCITYTNLHIYTYTYNHLHKNTHTYLHAFTVKQTYLHTKHRLTGTPVRRTGVRTVYANHINRITSHGEYRFASIPLHYVTGQTNPRYTSTNRLGRWLRNNGSGGAAWILIQGRRRKPINGAWLSRPNNANIDRLVNGRRGAESINR